MIFLIGYLCCLRDFLLFLLWLFCIMMYIYMYGDLSFFDSVCWFLYLSFL